MATHYDTLGASPGDDAKQLRRAYLGRARRLHPDQFMGRPPAELARAGAPVLETGQVGAAHVVALGL